MRRKMLGLGLGALMTLGLVTACGNFVKSEKEKRRCIPLSCGHLRVECGAWSDGCGSSVDCGDCLDGDTCRADGVCVFECTPASCEQMDKTCGTWNDGCAKTISCGQCPADKACNAEGRCVEASLVQQDRISDCGGFQARGGSQLGAGGSSLYCDAEVLHWQYEASTQTLELTDARILLNCCGDHSMTVEQQAGLYLVTETDAPFEGWGRCLCMCVFDFAVTVQGIAPGDVRLKIVREVTDEPDKSGLVFEGELDLTGGAGSIVIDESDVNGWCTEP